MRTDSTDAGVAVVVDDGDAMVEIAADFARRRGATLHLIALHATVRPVSFGASAARMRKGAAMREASEDRLRMLAASLHGIDVVTHAMAESVAGAAEVITARHSAVTFVTLAGSRTNRALRRALRAGDGSLLAVDGDGQVLGSRRYRRFARRSLITVGRAS